MVDGTAGLHFVGDEFVAAVEKQNAELLPVFEGHRGSQIRNNRRHRRQHRPLPHLALRSSERRRLHDLDLGDHRVRDAIDLHQPLRRRGDGFRKRPEAR